MTKLFLFQADFTLLFDPSVRNNEEAVKKLQKASTDQYVLKEGSTVFVLFVNDGQIEMADKCLAKTPGASSTSGWKMTEMTAAKNGQVRLNRV